MFVKIVQFLGCALSFIKIHAPMELLKRYAEILKIRMPIRVSMEFIFPFFSFYFFYKFIFQEGIRRIRVMFSRFKKMLVG